MTLALRGEDDRTVDTSVPSIGVNTLDFNRIGNQTRPGESE
jgi:hypothetical protein